MIARSPTMRVFVEHDAGTDHHIAADFAAGQNLRTGQNRCAVADQAVIADRCAGVNIDFCPQRAEGLTIARGLMPIATRLRCGRK